MILSKITLCFAVICILSACSPQRRLNRLIERNPELSTINTIYIDTTLKVIAPRAELSKKSPIDQLKDTINYQEGQLSVQLWSDPSQDTIHINAECDTVTLYVPFEKQIPVERIFYRKPRDRVILLVVLLCLLFFIGVNNYLRKRN